VVPPSAQPEVKSESATSSATRSFSLRQRLQLWLISWAGYLFIRLVGATLRFTIVREPGCMSDGRVVPHRSGVSGTAA